MKCLNVWKGSPRDIIHHGSGCPKCSISNINRHLRLTPKEYRVKLRATNSSLRPLEDYVNQKTKLLHKCCVCKSLRKYNANNLLNGHGCFFCAKDAAFKKRRVQLGKRVVQVQGYEDYAIDYLIQQGINQEKLLVSVKEGKPHIEYTYFGKKHLYLPDFYYTPKNRIIEVKGLYTLGLTRKEHWNKTVAKAKACVEQGYDFSLLLFDKGMYLKVPKDWYNLKWAEAKRLFN